MDLEMKYPHCDQWTASNIESCSKCGGLLFESKRGANPFISSLKDNWKLATGLTGAVLILSVLLFRPNPSPPPEKQALNLPTEKPKPFPAKSPTFLWEIVTGGRVYSSPAIGSDGTVYVGSNDYKVYALDGQSGAKKWEFKTGSPVSSSPAIGSDGTVYVGSENKKLYAIKTDSKGLAKSPWPMRGQNARHTGRVMEK